MNVFSKQIDVVWFCLMLVVITIHNITAVNNHEWQPKEESVYVQEDPVFREFVRRVKMNENPSPPSGKEGYEQGMFVV